MKRIILAAAAVAVSCFIAPVSHADRVYHVSVKGDDKNPGTEASPFKTISAAAAMAQPGDTVTVHAGIYRERVNPPRGGASDNKRIVYQSAPGEAVEIRGSEVIKQWEKVQNDTWRAIVPNALFGTFNPYSDVISGDWFGGLNREHHTGAVYLDGEAMIEAARLPDVLAPAYDTPLWYARVHAEDTYIWAQFKGVDPNKELVEINARRSVFYPAKPGMNYITVRGFTLKHAATPWAPPTAEQIGVIGTHWSRGWIIENNVISDSKNTCVTLGKYGDDWDNNAGSAEGYVGTLKRAMNNGWNKATIGHHLVRNNRIFRCGQAGLVGSMGAAFSTITRNEIHDIHLRPLYTGAEMAGIKLHGGIDVVISENRIYRSHMGIWLDWMTQGTRVTRNLFHNNKQQDLWLEVNHGPYLVDNNIFLSRLAVLDWSQGGAFVHNFFAGDLQTNHPQGRETPYFKPHSVDLVKLANIPGGDMRFYNNVFVRNDALDAYATTQSVTKGGNVFMYPRNSAKGPQPVPRLIAKDGKVYLEFKPMKDWSSEKRPVVNTTLLGKAKIPDQSYDNPDGSPLTIGADYLGNKRSQDNPAPGAFEKAGDRQGLIQVWPPR